MANITALLSGLIFGFGLIFSGLANPQKVISFLDIAGDWEVHLLWVMIGAIAVGSVCFTFVGKLKQSCLGLPIDLPAIRGIDKQLVLGSLIFGVGWGVAGICPGPALILIGAGHVEGIIFVVTMLLGMSFFEFIRRT